MNNGDDGKIMLRILSALIVLSLGGYANAQTEAPVAEVQQILADRGCAPGPVDGQWGSRSDAALRRLNAAASLELSHPLSASDLAALKASTQKCPDPTRIPVKGLRGVGINSLALWSSLSQTFTNEKLLEHFRDVEQMGFSHVVLISCADWILDLPCKKYFQTRDRIIGSVRTLVENTDLHIVLSLKGYASDKVNGRIRSTLQVKLEESADVRDEFTENWRIIAEALKDIPRERLSFAILNEPEFEFPQPSRAKQKVWESIASRGIEAVRSVSPDRVIIYEGIAKSHAFRRFKDGRGGYKYSSISSISRPLPYEDIVYGFHYYVPAWFAQQHKNFAKGPYGRPFDSRVASFIRQDAGRLVNWSNSNKVPVMLTEAGCVGYLDGKTEGPATPDDRPKYAAALYDNFVDKGISVSWFGLEKEKTVYLRNRKDPSEWIPEGRPRNQALLDGFHLTAR